MVNPYAQLVFPWICDFVLAQPYVAHLRSELLAQTSGEILEIGFGTGLNLAHYPAHISKITVVEPNSGMQRRARRRVRASRIAVESHRLTCESMPFADRSFDCVVSTWTMCSIAPIDRALFEVYRVLKPGGRLFFLEHGLSRDPKVERWQRRLNWLEMALAGGCRLDRDIKKIITAQPFSTVQVDEFRLDKTPATHGSMYRGVAIR